MNPNRQDSKVEELCDGCSQPHPPSELSLIGNGSIKVCQKCHAEAIAMVRE
jgi:predicted CXXCH cytochrome family protein